MRLLSNYLLALSIVGMLVTAVGCAEDQAAPVSTPEDELITKNEEAVDNESPDLNDQSVVISGLPAGEISITVEEIKEMPAESGEALSISSSGEENITPYKGVPLDTILEMHNVSPGGYTALRLLSLDGYSIEVPQEILETSRVIIAYELDGEPLQPAEQPLRVVIPGVRSMYWAKQLCQIELISNEGEITLNKIYILNDLLDELEVTDDMNVDVAELLGLDEESRIILVAADGLIKTETLAVDEHQYFIQLEGEDSPLFHSPELPRTMYVKKVAAIIHGDRAILLSGAYNKEEVSGRVFYDILREYLPDGEIVINPGLPSEQVINVEALSQLKIK